MRISLAIVLAALLLTGCKDEPPVTPSPDWRSPLSDASPFYGECTAGDHSISLDLADGGGTKLLKSVNDRQLIGAIEAITTKLINDGKTAKATDLTEQLKREKYTLTLTATGDKPMNTGQVYDQCSASVLVFSGVYKCGKCANWHASPASAFVLTETGIVVTNYHVLEKNNNETYVAMSSDGKIFPVKEVLAANQVDDLAIVQLALPEGVKLKPLAIEADAPVGSPVTLISHPDRRFYTLTTGIISRYHSAQKGNATMNMVSITADYARGSSGAPVLNDRGAVVGIVASTHSVYYTNENGKQENLQMVFKQCIPAASLLKMIEVKK